ncbi:hypothetical protein AALP_AA8G290800 [Arabis alpina]|uniref:PGG domain-containing protein n=1 Tax=Arabis alpina TaxID=50452 RepID=A0A087GA63_ARAAL|nr:hypothetical protein AALP_AA8G290800 [Arabis alpina]
MELMTLKPSLALKLNTSEDLTIKCETVVHVAVKNHQNEAFKVLLGWLKRENREEILDWKDEDGNTVFHIAASTNQTEVIKLLRRTIKVNAKNLDGKTAMDILQTDQSPCFPKASRLLRIAKERLLCGSTMTLAGYLSKKPSFIEKRSTLLGLTNLSRTRHSSVNTSDSRSVILVVAILIVTATYQAGLSPPGGFWQEDSPILSGRHRQHFAGQMTMEFYSASYFFVIAFFSSLYVIMILIVGLPMWKVLYGSTAALGIANVATFYNIFPSSRNIAEYIIRGHFVLGYPVTVASIVFAPCVAFIVNKYRRHRVDFPAKYFSLPHELS